MRQPGRSQQQCGNIGFGQKEKAGDPHWSRRSHPFGDYTRRKTCGYLSSKDVCIWWDFRGGRWSGTLFFIFRFSKYKFWSIWINHDIHNSVQLKVCIYKDNTIKQRKKVVNLTENGEEWGRKREKNVIWFWYQNLIKSWQWFSSTSYLYPHRDRMTRWVGSGKAAKKVQHIQCITNTFISISIDFYHQCVVHAWFATKLKLTELNDRLFRAFKWCLIFL